MIYVVFTCDEWKSKDSMRLVGATTNFGCLKKQIKKMVKEGTIEMENKEVPFVSNEYENFQDINKSIKYCYIEGLDNGTFDS